MRTFKVMALTFVGMLSVGMANAQEEVEVSVGADVVTNYLWRGQKLGEGSIQPTLGISYNGLSIGAWGSYGITNPDDTKEFDLTVAYTTGGFNIGITDYFFTNQYDGVKYFKYDAHETAHVYVEFAAPFKLGGLDWSASLGVVPFATDFYSDADGFAVTNLSVKTTKDIKVTDTFSVPVFGQITANPSNGKAYFALGFTLNP